ncbi:MAG: hypothetical protein KHX03_01335 [Clostridium sp.]|nr:hypothetical protein [Clostridium sp.]
MQNTNLEQIKDKLFSTASSSEKMNEEIRKSIKKIREEKFRRLHPSMFNDGSEVISNEVYQKISELADFIAIYIREVGKEQAILDFQVGLNLLNDYKTSSLIESKIKLEEDSDFGEKTYAALLDVLQNYPIEILKHYIKLGAANNAIWSTKNNQKIDTDKKVENITLKLNERIN